MGSDRVVKVPEKYRGGLPEEAYRAGWKAGRCSKELDTIASCVMFECTNEILQHGTGSLLSSDGAVKTLRRLAGRVERFKDVQEKAHVFSETFFRDRLKKERST